MIWQIAFKEIYHNLTTLRFALIIIILPLLFVANSLIYSLGGYNYTAQVNTYNQQVAQNRDHIEDFANKGLAELALIGPGEIPKRPNRLTFCADGADKFVPRAVTMQNVGMLSRAGYDELVEGYQWRPPWILEYPLQNKGGNVIQRIKIDWVFIGILMSFFAILFTFDAIAGERARGTLSLMMSNAVSRGQVLLGKYLGAFVTIFLPLIISILINLLTIYFFGNIPFASEHWLRILGMVGLFALLVSIFIFLGLFFSSRVSNAITSLVWLLLTWVFLAFIFPSLFGTFVGNLNPIPSVDEVLRQKHAQLGQLYAEYDPFNNAGDIPPKLSKAASAENPKATLLWGDFLAKEVETKTRFSDGHIDQQFKQVQLARDLTQISPIATFQYAMEGLANTSIVSYMNFVKQARRYRQTFIDFIKTEDQDDPESLHIYPVREGLSQKLVDLDAVPIFEEQISYRSVLSQVGLLVLFNLLFFIIAQISFMKGDLK
ncbi:hypothetical protein C6499_13445 [Candidatus Poribacteria bacterium]|nr:MAG: hypothetical protein C6499_13445 [Candidatus Poribacteria bacterium]